MGKLEVEGGFGPQKKMATASKQMIQEVKAAVEYWGQFVPEVQRDAFLKHLSAELTIEYQKHWHETEPHRGSAFRSIKCDGYGVDPRLTKVAESSGVQKAAFPKNVVMWVNPGEVKVRSEGSWASKTIYSDSEHSARKSYHPLALQLKLEPTQYHISSGDDSSASESPSSSPPLSPNMTPQAAIPVTMRTNGQDVLSTQPQIPTAAVPVH